MAAALKVRLTGNWRQAHRDLATARSRLGIAIDRAVAMEAHDVRKQVIQGIREQSPGGQRFAPISRLTLAMRKAQGFRGSKALIRTAALMGSIAVKRAGKGRYFVGVLRGTKSRDGRMYTQIAAVHEYGATFVVKVTPKMRRMIMMALRKAGILKKRRASRGSGALQKRVMVVRIPPRPFLKPVIDRVAARPGDVRRRMAQRLSKMLGYTLGK